MVYESNHYAWISICSWNDSGHTKTKQSYRQTGIVVRLNAVFFIFRPTVLLSWQIFATWFLPLVNQFLQHSIKLHIRFLPVKSGFSTVLAKTLPCLHKHVHLLSLA